MKSPNGEDNIDAWTGMVTDFEDIEIDIVTAATTAPSDCAADLDSLKHKRSPWALADLLWKLMAARSEFTSAAILASLSADESKSVRKLVAENQHCPPEAMVLLSQDADASVRTAVARNRITPLFLLRELAHDENVDVRLAIAGNSQMPDAILLSLYLDPDPFVADRASQTLAA